MQARLFGRDAVLRGLVPRLIGLDYDRQQTLRQEHPDRLPAILLTGRHGSGKTAVLAALDDAYRGRLPLARVDFSGLRPNDREQTAVSNTSGVVEALDRLVEELAPAVPGFGRFRFSRLLPGLLAVSSWHRGNAPEQDLARDRITRLFTSCGLNRTEDPGSSGSDWMVEISRQIAHVRDQGDLESVAAISIGLFLERHGGRRGGRAVQEWYRARGEGAEDGTDALVRLGLRFHRGGDFRQAVERTLVAALLEDLGDAYTGWKRLNRAPRPLALLDNAHTAAGHRLLELLLEHRAEPAQRTDPLVVVATRLGANRESYPGAVSRAMPEVATDSGWRPAGPGEPSAGLLTIELPPLSLDDVLSMLDDTPHTLTARLPSVLHRLTAGNPLGLRTLCEAVVHSTAHRPVDPQELLDLCTPAGRPVTEALLEQLIPPPQIRELLIALSPARDRDAAQVLAAHGVAPGADPLPAASAGWYLEEERWTEEPAPHLISDPFLRTLLVHQLRRTFGEREGPRSWYGSHRALAEHYAALGGDGEADELRHTLSLGDARTVVARLTDRFPEWEAQDWLECAQYVATAPHPPVPRWTDQRCATARGELDSQYPGADDVQRCVNRLLHGLWYLADPVTEPLDELCTDLGAELSYLSMRHPAGHAALSRAAREWPVAARQQRHPYPVSPPASGPLRP